jgi:hypothetical protein
VRYGQPQVGQGNQQPVGEAQSRPATSSGRTPALSTTAGVQPALPPGQPDRIHLADQQVQMATRDPRERRMT